MDAEQSVKAVSKMPNEEKMGQAKSSSRKRNVDPFTYDIRITYLNKSFIHT